MISVWVGAPQNWPGYKFFTIPLINNLLKSFLNLLIPLTELKTLLNNLFLSYLKPIYFFYLTKEHTLKEHMRNYKILKITYSKP